VDESVDMMHELRGIYSSISGEKVAEAHRGPNYSVPTEAIFGAP